MRSCRLYGILVMIKYKLNDQRVRRGKEIVELGELGGVVVSWWLRWSGDIFGCDERKVFLGRMQMITGFGICYGESPRVVGVLRSL